MQFDNLVMYCKGIYKRRADYDVHTLWKDFYHCLVCDGYHVEDKEDIVALCTSWLDDFLLLHPEKARLVSVHHFYNEMQSNRRLLGLGDEVSTDDLFLYTFRVFVRFLNGDLFTKTFKPSEFVLPLSEGVKEFDCMNRWFAELPEQKLGFVPDYATRENNLSNIK